MLIVDESIVDHLVGQTSQLVTLTCVAVAVLPELSAAPNPAALTPGGPVSTVGLVNSERLVSRPVSPLASLAPTWNGTGFGGGAAESQTYAFRTVGLSPTSVAMIE